jgi:hypothetical protein
MHVAGNLEGLSVKVSGVITFLTIIEVCEQYHRGQNTISEYQTNNFNDEVYNLKSKGGRCRHPALRYYCNS